MREHYNNFIKAEERAKGAKKQLDSSRAIRQKIKFDLGKCPAGDWDTLEKKVKALNIIKFNEDVRSVFCPSCDCMPVCKSE